MIDLHVHILPGLDDGPGDWETSVEMCRIAADDGIRTLVATPHFHEGLFEPDRQLIADRARELADRIADVCRIEILIGADVRIGPNLPAKIRDGVVPTLNDSGYLLLELPDGAPLPELQRIVFDLMVHGVRPVLTHPERNPQFQGREERLRPLVDAGVLVQLSAMSVCGGFGRAARRAAHRMLRLGLTHCLASDAHSRVRRPPRLSGAVAEAGRLIGPGAARRLVVENPDRILRGEEPAAPRPTREDRGPGLLTRLARRSVPFLSPHERKVERPDPERAPHAEHAGGVPEERRDRGGGGGA